MLDVLIASRPISQIRPAPLIAAAVLHGMAFVLCVAGTRVVISEPPRQVDDTTLVYLPRLSPPAVRTPVVLHVGRPGGNGGEGAGVVLSANPPPRGFQVVDVPSGIPSSIPPVDLDQRVLDPRDFTGRGVEGGVGWGVLGGTGSPDQPIPDARLGDALYAAELSDARFAPAELVVQPHFVHPRLLLAAGIGGRVTVQFIIDTLGLVEPASVLVVTTTHEAFATAAREGITEARFTPARYGGRPVRQLSRLPIRFTVASTDSPS